MWSLCGSIGNIMLIIRHEEIGLYLGVTIMVWWRVCHASRSGKMLIFGENNIFGISYRCFYSLGVAVLCLVLTPPNVTNRYSIFSFQLCCHADIVFKQTILILTLNDFCLTWVDQLFEALLNLQTFGSLFNGENNILLMTYKDEISGSGLY